MRWLALIVALAVYLAGFAIDHIETWAKPGWVFDLVIFAPIAVVIAAARLWPSWWLLPLVFVFFFFVPIGVDELERRLPWYPVGVYGPGYYEQSGMDYLTTSFLAWEAFPAVVITAIAVPIARYWRHGSR
jgi:hypothetical protein